MSRPGPRVAVVVVSYGSSALLADALAGLGGPDPVAAVVVDGYSGDDERHRVTTACSAHGWTLVALPDNPGFGAAANAGVRRAEADGAEVVLLLNPDASVDRDVVDALVADCVDGGGRMVSPRIDSEDGALWFAGGAILLDRGLTRTRGIDVAEVAHPWVTAACLAVPVHLWRALGGFDERYFMYWEDVDLSTRCRAAGHDVRVRRDLVAVHAVGGTQAARGKSDLYVRYNCRNRLLFAAVHLEPGLLRRWVRTAPRYGWEVVRRGGRRAILERLGAPVWWAAAGTVEGAWCAWTIRRRAAR